ncbi:DUF4880 domain-containing protein [Pseudomonas sp. CBSPCBW29]|nr:DUF4880 domain-containing protein [Pseudomonas sp. CBSPCBW29]
MSTEQPIAPDIIERATAWMARLWADDVSAEDHANCLRWRAEHPHHELAWTRLLGFEQKLNSVPAAVAKHSLAEPETRIPQSPPHPAAAGPVGRSRWPHLRRAPHRRLATGKCRP